MLLYQGPKMLEERQPEKSLCNEKEVERKVAGLNPMDEEVFSGHSLQRNLGIMMMMNFM